MSVTKPFYRTVRQFVDGSYMMSGNGYYVKNAYNAMSGKNFIRAFEIIQKDIIELFEYIEPSTKNNSTYSLRLFNLLIRICTEVEANFKAILKANTYSRNVREWSISDYFKVNRSHFLSDYEVRLPHWRGRSSVLKPFEAWSEENGQLKWYKAYNNVKHDRVGNLDQATLGNVVAAFCGLAVLISSQYLGDDFREFDYITTESYVNDGFEPCVGDGYLSVKYPENIPEELRYDFDAVIVMRAANPFQKFNYDLV